MKKIINKIIKQQQKNSSSNMAKEMLSGLFQVLLLVGALGLVAVTIFSILVIILGYIYEL